MTCGAGAAAFVTAVDEPAVTAVLALLALIAVIDLVVVIARKRSGEAG